MSAPSHSREDAQAGLNSSPIASASMMYARLMEILETPGAAMPDDLRLMFLHGLKAHAETGKPLSACLGLSKRGRGGNIGAQIQKHTRNRLIVEAFELMPEQDRWERIKSFSSEVKRFELNVWPRLRDYGTPPDNLTPMRKVLFRAFKVSEGKVPTSTAGLADVLSQFGK
ncbi:hypothetical protein GPROT1_00649 [Gammaproteobacteria bacterium]|nr:hypothetical protein GPROT1_00649 [Gammaproteobacteria bacterium]